jgi:hypothetical protein
MRGPFERLKYDLRRIWECPRCGVRRRTDGTTTTQFCKCEKSGQTREAISMKLIGDGARRTVPPIARPKPEIAAAAVTAEQAAVASMAVTQVDVLTPSASESVTIATLEVAPAVPPADPPSELPPAADEAATEEAPPEDMQS